ncbi:MAG: hypothetical protein PHC61_16705 [Chitinivibrionales bacterium]|nr:hypothetical protein [Chitinivibrionales bacterium]
MQLVSGILLLAVPVIGFVLLVYIGKLLMKIIDKNYKTAKKEKKESMLLDKQLKDKFMAKYR